MLPDYDMFSMPSQRKAEPKTVDKPQGGEPVPPARVWGNVLRTLRSNGNAVLWTVCQDVIAKARDGVLTITVSNDSEYQMFSREDHLKTLTETARLFGDYRVEISRKAVADDGLDEFQRDVDELKRTFGEDIVNIINED